VHSALIHGFPSQSDGFDSRSPLQCFPADLSLFPASYLT
jgi:hypothetical protein